MTSQYFIGPALIPGFMATGLIVLAIGSIKIVGETLNKEEILGIALIIIAIFLLGISELSIEIANTNLLEIGLIMRIFLFTLIVIIISVISPEVITLPELVRESGGLIMAWLLKMMAGLG